MLKYLRIAGILIGMAANVSILREWLARNDLELRDMVGDIILRESLLVGGATLATGIIIVSAWPALVWCHRIPARRRAARAEAAVRERAEIISLLETVRDRDDTMKYAFSGGEEQARAASLVAQRKLEAMGFGVSLESSGSRRGQPKDWKIHAARAIAYINVYGVEATRAEIAQAQAKARAALQEGEPPS